MQAVVGRHGWKAAAAAGAASAAAAVTQQPAEARAAEPLRAIELDPQQHEEGNESACILNADQDRSRTVAEDKAADALANILTSYASTLPGLKRDSE